MIMSKLRNWLSDLTDEQLRICVYVGFAILAIALVGWALLQGSTWKDLALNLGAGFVGALIAFIIFDQVIGRRERSKAEQQRLTLELRVVDTPDARRAILQRMKDLDLLKGALLNWIKTLQEVDLSGANLEGANLGGSELQKSNFYGANLRRVTLVARILKVLISNMPI
jgi:hypothetical protein